MFSSRHLVLILSALITTTIWGAPRVITIQPNGTAGKDALVNRGGEGTEQRANLNAGVQEYLFTGQIGNHGGVTRSLIQFPLPALVPGSTIVSARLGLTSATTDPSSTLEVYLMRQAWVEGTWASQEPFPPADGATWQTYDGVNPWPGISGFRGLDGGGYNNSSAITTSSLGSATATSPAPGMLNWIPLDPARVQQWFNGTLANNGVLIRSQNENSGSTSQGWASSDHPTANWRPILELTVDEPALVGDPNTAWVNIGPGVNVKLRSVAVSPAYPADPTIVAGSQYQPGTFWKSTNNGTSWTSTQPLGSTSFNVPFDAIRLSPGYRTGSADQRVFLGGPNSAWVYGSGDGGTTWTRNVPPVGGDKSTWQITASPAFASDNTLFVVSNSGIYRSVDGGATWPLQLFPGTGTWSSVVTSPNYAADSTVFAASYATGIYKSVNRGVSFTASNAGIPSGTNVYGLAVSPHYSTDSTVFAVTGGPGVFKSVDGGATWSSVLSVSSPAFGANSIALSPNYATDQTAFVLSFSNQVHWTRNGGATWTPLTRPLTVSPAPNFLSLAVSPDFANDRRIFLASDGGTGGIFTTTINPGVAPSADLLIASAGSPGTVISGANVTYTLTVTNQGPSTATSVTVTDALPAGATLVSASASQGSCSGVSSVTCALGTMANNGVATVTVVVRSGSPGSMTNSATVSAAESDPAAANNTASTTTTVTPADTTPPVITASVTPLANAAGWHNVNPTISWTVLDPESGIATSSGCSVVTHTVETSSIVYTCTASNGAGLSGNGSVTIKLDRTAPAVAFGVAAPAANAAGWNNANVSIPFTVSDSLSGVATSSTPSPLVFTGEGASLTASVSVTDAAGNSATVTSPVVRIDRTAPAVTGLRAPLANAFGWNNSNVVVSASGVDALSGLDSCSPAQTVSAEGANQSVNLVCSDRAGNTGTASVTGINIDKTAPSASAARSPAPNAAGWNNTDVVVSFVCADGLSGLAPGNPPSPITISAEGSGLAANGLCADRAGNTSAAGVAGINIDKTAPTVTNTTVSPASIALNTSTVVSALLTDAGGSNLASSSYTIDTAAPIALGSPTGATAAVSGTTALFTSVSMPQVCVTANDVAGNTSAAQCAALVVYDPSASVSGAGAILSPAGAYPAQPGAAGRARLTLNLRYRAGNAPEGNVDFRLNDANLRFDAVSYQWLIASGPQAQVRGTGTINGAGSFDFLLTVVDGDAPGGSGPDRFRMKITAPGGVVVYDNQMGAPDNGSATTALENGNIIIN